MLQSIPYHISLPNQQLLIWKRNFLNCLLNQSEKNINFSERMVLKVTLLPTNSFIGISHFSFSLIHASIFSNDDLLETKIYFIF